MLEAGVAERIQNWGRHIFKLGEDMIQNRQLLSDFQKEILS